VDRLVLAAQQIPNLKLIVIDPASRFRGGDENASQDVTRFVEAVERVAQATGAAVLIIHHANKGSISCG
jgi:RecA-family ATPase